MIEVWTGILASLACATLLFFATTSLLGIAQQVGYRSREVWRWLRKPENLFFNRLGLWGLMGFLTTAIVALAFSIWSTLAARIATALPFFAFCVLFLIAEKKYDLKVPVKYTARVKKVAIAYAFSLACVSYVGIALLDFLGEVIGDELYRAFAFTPFAFIPLLAPFVFLLANGVVGIFANASNRRFVEKARKRLDETEILRVAVVGSYGKTSVKNILASLLSKKYSLVATPQSYNTPIGIAKTVFSPEFAGKQVFIAEMGARRAGDIAELCGLVKPDYAIFTGVCAQHIQSFGSLENVFKAKSEIFTGVKEGGKIVCGREALARAGDLSTRELLSGAEIKDLSLCAKKTTFTLALGGREISVNTRLLGVHNAENIALAATLAYEMGVSADEIAQGIAVLEPVPHRLQLLENGGRYILDDAYNANEKGAREAIEALKRFDGGKWLITPGIVEGGILEEKINRTLGEQIAKANLDRVILVGETLVGAVKTGYLTAGGDEGKLLVVKTLALAQKELAGLNVGDCVLFLNDLPDAY